MTPLPPHPLSLKGSCVNKCSIHLGSAASKKKSLYPCQVNNHLYVICFANLELPQGASSRVWVWNGFFSQELLTWAVTAAEGGHLAPHAGCLPF